jgi:type I restriction enzyme, S subunit
MGEEWLNLTLGEIITLQRGYDLRTADRNESGTVPVVSSSGMTGFHDEPKVLPPGVVTGRYGTIGKVFFLSETFWPLNTTLYVKDFKGNDPFFIYYYLQTIDFEKYSDKTGVPGVNRNDLHQIGVTLPPLPEQKKIAEILCEWDKAISLTGQLIGTNQRRKKALMQQLLTGKVRFREFVQSEARQKTDWGEVPVDWNIVQQGSVAKFYNGRAYKLSEWEKEGVPVIRLQNLTGSGDQFYYSNLKLPQHQYVNKGDLLYMWSATFGPHIWKGEKAIYHYHIWKIECSERIDKFFHFHLLDYLTARWMSISHGMGLLHITKGTMESLAIPLPSVKEQQKIVAVLQACDTEIDLLHQKLVACRQQKKGLMQQLLTGRVRVQPSS